MSLHTGKSHGLRLRLAKLAMKDDSSSLGLCIVLETCTMVGLFKLNELLELSLMWTKMELLVSWSVIAFLWESILAFKERPDSP